MTYFGAVGLGGDLRSFGADGLVDGWRAVIGRFWVHGRVAVVHGWLIGFGDGWLDGWFLNKSYY